VSLLSLPCQLQPRLVLDRIPELVLGRGADAHDPGSVGVADEEPSRASQAHRRRDWRDRGYCASFEDRVVDDEAG